MKKVLAGLLGGALILGVGMVPDKAEAATLDEILKQDASIVNFEGMAYRERAEKEQGYWAKRVAERRNGSQNCDNDTNGMDSFNKTHGRGNKNDGYVKHDVRRGPDSSQSEDDPNGIKAFNRTHGRANSDGSDGMAWREKGNKN